jgi:seryl-tRNA synthetase
MLAIEFIVQNLEKVRQNLQNRKSLNEAGEFACFIGGKRVFMGLEGLLDLNEKRKKAILEAETLQAQKNKIAGQIGQAKSQKLPTDELMQEAEQVKANLEQIAGVQDGLETQLKEALSCLPNITLDDVPIGLDEAGNVEIKRVGTPKKFDFTPKPHDEIGAGLGLMDFETAGTVSGSRFVFLKGALAKLERALGQFMLEHNVERGYTEVSPPLLVRPNAFFGTGQLPKFEGNFYEVGEDYDLIPTAEVSLTNMVSGKILKEADLPMRLTACTPCFRSEAGAAGRDTKGMIRQHQFIKTELVTICTPSNSQSEHEYMLETAETVLQKLELPYRVVKLCTGEMGGTAAKTYDIEVWLPSQNTYREISSISNTLDFQARRMMARFKDASGKNQYLHTLNGSSLAVGRTLVAILENYQNADGSVEIPKA